MMKFKKTNYKFWHSPLALVILFCILVLFVYKIIDLIKKERDTSYKKDLILDKIEDLNSRADTLSKDILKLESDDGKEEIIREKYQVAKEGEKMVIIVEEDNNNLQEEEIKTRHGFWNWIKKIFTR